MLAEAVAREGAGREDGAALPRQEVVVVGQLTAMPADCRDWDRFAIGCDGAVQEQLAAFASSRWPSVQLEPWIFSRGGDTIGGALVMVQPLPARLGQLAVCKWGPLIRNELPEDAELCHAQMVEALVEIYARRRGLMLSVVPRAEPAGRNGALCNLHNMGFRAGAELSFPDRYLVNVRQSDEAALASLEQKWRYNLRKSFNQGLEFEAGGTAQLAEFDALYQAMSDRKRFADHSAYATLDRFIEACVPEARPRLFFVRRNAKLVAGAVIFTSGRTAVYLYGATNEAALPLRAGYFMHWHIIRWLRENTRTHWYDLGGTDGFNGLHQFKKGLVGSAGFVSPVPPMMNRADTLHARIAGGLAHAVHGGVQKLKYHAGNWRHGLVRPDQIR